MPSYSTVIDKLVTRLQWHTAAVGRLLYGAKFEALPIAQVDGATDLPHVRCFTFDIAETFRPNKPISCTIDVSVLVSAKRGDGLKVLAEWVEKVLDAAEITTDGTSAIDPRLDNALLNPFRARTERAQVGDLSHNQLIIFTLVPRELPSRGKRRL